mgnify:FL=1
MKSTVNSKNIITFVGIIFVYILFSTECHATQGQGSERPTVSKKTELPLPLLDGLRWRKIPAGYFQMGSNYAEKVACSNGVPPVSRGIKESDSSAYCREHGPSNWFLDEAPIRQVQIANDYWMSDAEITVAQFRIFVEETGYLTVAERIGKSLGEAAPSAELNSYGATRVNWRQPWGGMDAIDNNPVVHVAWEDAVAFCDWLSAKSGLNVRLPTEAEWEYAAQAGTYGGNQDRSTGEYSWGVAFYKDDLPVGNFADQAFGSRYPAWKYPVVNTHNDGYAMLAPVRSYKPNSFGLYDMSGNAWEWTASVYRSRAYDEPNGRNTKLDENYSEGFNHTMRGGAFDFELPFLRIQKRRSLAFVRHDHDVLSGISIGFRIVSNGPFLGDSSEPELSTVPFGAANGVVESDRPAGGKWISRFDGDTIKITFVSEAGMGCDILTRSIPNKSGETESRIRARIYDSSFGYFPKVMPTPSGRDAWIWDCFNNELIKISDTNVLTIVLFGELDGGREIRQIRIRGEMKVAMMLGLYAFDDYGDELIATVVLDENMHPKIKIVKDRWWHNQGPHLESLSKEYLWPQSNQQ